MTPAMIGAVAAGGALGASARYLVTVAATRMFGHEFPWGTAIVNVAGSFFMGALITYMALRWSATQEARAFLATGVLGGFTTFSTFSLDIATLYERKHPVIAGVYALGSVGLGLIALFAGMALMRQLYGDM
jgi:CrcB protein